MTKALVTGSFDPVTRGHFEIIERASRIFDEVTVCIFINPEKSYRFSEEERLSFIRMGIDELGLSNVKADVSSGYVADYAKEHSIGYVLRGVRNADDMAYEVAMARENNRRNPTLETLIWPSNEKSVGISSTAVRESLKKGIVLKEALLPSTAHAILTIINKENSST